MIFKTNNNPHLLLFMVMALIFFNINNCYSSNYNQDSLLLLLNDGASEMEKHNILMKLIYHGGKDDEEKVLKWKNQAVMIGQNLNSDSLTLQAFKICAKRYETLGLNDKSEQESLDLLQKALDLNNYNFAAIANNQLGNLNKILGKLDKAIEYYLAAKDFDLKNNNKIDALNQELNIAKIYRLQGKIDEALSIGERLLKIFKEENDYEGLSLSNNLLGRIHRGLGDYDLAEKYYLANADLTLQENDLKKAAVAFNNLGNIAQARAQHDKALEYYIKSKDLKETFNDFKGLSIAHLNIGMIHLEFSNYEDAEREMIKGIDYAEKAEYNYLLITGYSKLSELYYNKEDFKQGIKWGEKAVQFGEKIQHKRGLANAYSTVAHSYMKDEDYSKGFQSAVKGLDLAESLKWKSGIATSLVLLAEGYQSLLNNQSELSQSQLKSITTLSNSDVEKYLIKAKDLSLEIGNYPNVVQALQALKSYYGKVGNYKKQAKTAELFISYTDTLITQARTEALAESETKYETAEKEKEIAILQKEKELQAIQAKYTRNNFIAIGSILSLLFMFWINSVINQNKIKRANQINELRTKISSDLHDDVGSILTGLSMQSELLEMKSTGEGQIKAQEIGVLAKSAMSRMRDAVWVMDARRDNWDSLIIRMNEFGQEQLVRNNIQFRIDHNNIDLSKKIDSQIRQNIYLIFKEALTNILKHSNADKVMVYLNNGLTEFEMKIQDNGNVENKIYKTSGLGTENMKMRAEQIQADLSFMKENGFAVIFKRAVIIS